MNDGNKTWNLFYFEAVISDYYVLLKIVILLYCIRDVTLSDSMFYFYLLDFICYAASTFHSI